jgi:hypothetical protein
VTEIRHYGIYTLPDGGLYVAVKDGGDKYFLYPREGGTLNPPSYAVNPDGRIVAWVGEAKGWTVDDLTDTGENF